MGENPGRWPGAERRNPPLGSSTWVVRSALAGWLRSQAVELEGRAPVRILNPAQALRELRRVTAPGGRLLAPTHGVQVYHPSPVDYWRGTHAGLRRLFEQSLAEQEAGWASLRVEAAAGTASALAMLLGTYVEIALRRTVLAPGPVWLFNRAGSALDARSAGLRQPVPGSLIPNSHVIADV